MATKKWFVVVGTEEMGPLGPRGLRQMVRAGEIKTDTLLRREDHEIAVTAGQVRGLLPASHAEVAPHHRALPKIHGPYTALWPIGWPLAAGLLLFAALGALGLRAAITQLSHAAAVATGTPLLGDVADPGLFGLGVWAVLALVAAGGAFVWWLWTARVNLPHLICAHVHYGPSWAIAAWFVPFLNLVRPLDVVTEVDRLSAEADADGDASVHANHRLLVPWWGSAVLGTVAALVYVMLAKTSADELLLAAALHLVAGACAILAGVLGAWLVLRTTNNQERAHERHPEPVELRHEFGSHRGRSAPTLRTAAH